MLLQRQIRDISNNSPFQVLCRLRDVVTPKEMPWEKEVDLELCKRTKKCNQGDKRRWWHISIIIIIITITIIIIIIIIEVTHSKTILENTFEIEPQPVALDFKNLSHYSNRSK